MKNLEVMALLVIGLWLLWGVVGVHFFQKIICPDANSCAAYGQVGDIFGGINAFFAALGFVGLAISIENARRSTEEERSRNRDRELLDQVLKSYGWAYNAFTEDSRPGVGVRANRLNWLIAARHLLRAQELAGQISSVTYRTIQQENEEHWRTQFYIETQHEQLLDPNFYFEWSDPERPIDFRSAIVIADFLSWKKEVRDPIDNIDAHELLLKDGFKSSRLGRGIETFIVVNAPKFTEEHQRRIKKREDEGNAK